nr:MAG TPA: hypothetical protein [Caudoviricetes sp.]
MTQTFIYLIIKKIPDCFLILLHFSLKRCNKVLFYVIIYCTIPTKGLASFYMTSHSTNSVRILCLLVKITYKVSTSHMRRGNITNRTLFFFTCSLVSR